MSQPRILVLLDYYIPGYKSGGPLRTIANMVTRLGRRFDFWVLTRDRDATDTAPYPGVRADAWVEVGQARVWYASPGGLGARAIRQRVAEVGPDVIYLNSFFSKLTVRTLALRRAGLIPPLPVVLAPRGEFAPGALRLKAPKKRAYMTLARVAGLYRGLIWQASASHEAADIGRVVGIGDPSIAPDIPAPLGPPGPPAPPKAPGRLRLVYVARIAAVKNLHMLLELLPRLRGDVELAIYGPLREPAYWAQCQALIAALPPSVRVRYEGPVEHEGVAAAMAWGHAYVLPTLGENFGHSILEALALGRPVVISDMTPWRALEADRAGWDLPLTPEAWVTALQRLVDMDHEALQAWCAGARRRAEAFVGSPALAEASAALFARALSEPRSLAAPSSTLDM